MDTFFYGSLSKDLSREEILACINNPIVYVDTGTFTRYWANDPNNAPLISKAQESVNNCANGIADYILEKQQEINQKQKSKAEDAARQLK